MLVLQVWNVILSLWHCYWLYNVLIIGTKLRDFDGAHNCNLKVRLDLN